MVGRSVSRATKQSEGTVSAASIRHAGTIHTRSRTTEGVAHLELEFLCLESQVFSLNMQDAFLKLGPSMLSEVGIPLDSEREERNLVTQLANRLSE